MSLNSCHVAVDSVADHLTPVPVVASVDIKPVAIRATRPPLSAVVGPLPAVAATFTTTRIPATPHQMGGEVRPRTMAATPSPPPTRSPIPGTISRGCVVGD